MFFDDEDDGMGSDGGVADMPASDDDEDGKDGEGANTAM